MALFSDNKTILNNSESKQTSVLNGEAGGITFKTHVDKDPYGSFIPEDRSSVTIYDKFGKNLIQLIGGTTTLKTASDLCFYTGQNLFFSVKGDTQHSISGSKHEYIKGDQTIQVGQQTQKQKEAARKLQTITDQIDREKIASIQESEGTMVPCPICSQKLLSERGQNYFDSVFRTARKYLRGLGYPLDVVQFFVNLLVVPFMSTITNFSLVGGKGCGSPGCKNGMVKSAYKSLQDGNAKAADAYEKNKEQIAKAQVDMGSAGAKVQRDASDVVWQIGNEKNKAPTVATVDAGATAFYLTNSKIPGDMFGLGSKGTAKTAIHSDPLINPGSLLLDVANKCTIISGSPGMEFQTTGKLSINGAVTNVFANEGELTLTSANKTILKGKNILIDAKDRSGDTGVRIESDNTMVAGKLSVTGDFALKGSLMMDGGLYCTHLTVPSERIPTGPSGSAHFCHSNATWNDMAPTKATALDTWDKGFKKVTRDLYNTLTLNILSLSEIITLVEETYSTVMTKLPSDNFGAPTGVAFSHWYTGPSPSLIPLKIIGWCAAGPVDGFVIPGQIQPIYNFTHVHNSPGSNHSHDTTVPAFDGHAGAAASRAARPEPSHVPTPAKSGGMGTSPGHKNYGALTSCGGGGGAFVGSSNVDDAINQRNDRYGIVGNPFDNSNFVNITPKTGNYGFNPDGSLNPPPDFNGLGNC